MLTQECQTASELALWRYNPSKQGVTCDLQATPKYCSSTISMQLLTKKKERKHLVWAHHRKHSGYKKEARQTLRSINQKAEHTCSRWNLAEHGKNIFFLQPCPSVINKQKPSTQHLCSLFLTSAYKYCKAVLILHIFQGNVLSSWKANVFCMALKMDLWLSKNPSCF